MDIKINNLCKAFNGQQVLKDLSCLIKEGETTAVMGPSGCGKSTLANILLGLMTPDSGSIDGLNGRQLSAVFQEDRLCENLSALSNIRLVCPPNTPREIIEKALCEVDLGDALLKPAHDLSGGMRRRIAILRSLLAPADLLVMDEPFKGLDTATKETVLAWIKAHLDGRTLILITHEENEARKLNASQLIHLPMVARS